LLDDIDVPEGCKGNEPIRKDVSDDSTGVVTDENPDSVPVGCEGSESEDESIGSEKNIPYEISDEIPENAPSGCKEDIVDGAVSGTDSGKEEGNSANDIVESCKTALTDDTAEDVLESHKDTRDAPGACIDDATGDELDNTTDNESEDRKDDMKGNLVVSAEDGNVTAETETVEKIVTEDT
jgi:hypothetical protein